MITKENDCRIKISLPNKKAKSALPVKSLEEVAAIYRGAPGAPGAQGKQGEKGDCGIGIVDIEQTESESFCVILTNGLRKIFNIPRGLPGKKGDKGAIGKDGKPGRGIQSITQPKEGIAQVNYTDGTHDTLKLPAGKDGREIELGWSPTHLQWRYVGDNVWIDLFPIPKQNNPSQGAGTVKLVKTVNGLMGNVVLTAGDNIALSISGNSIEISSPSTPLMGNLFIKTPDNETITLVASALYAFSIDQLHNLVTGSGIIKVTVKINGVTVTGLSAITVNSTPQNPLATAAKNVAIGDEVTLVLSNNSSASGLKFTMGMARL